MAAPTAELAAVTREAVQAGGDYLRTAFRDGVVDGKYDTTDVKAVADREVQQRVRSVIDAEYPTHLFEGEESTLSSPPAANDYRWVVDPLDGTNNFASGYPKFATAVAVLHDDRPVVAGIYEPLVDSLYLARRDEGATLNGDPLQASSSLPLAHGTVGLVIGLDAVTDPTLATTADTIERTLRDHCKRVVATWAPCVDWGLLARGSIEGIVCFHPGAYEHHAGSLLAVESGIEAVDTVADDGLYVGTPDRATTEKLRSIVVDAI